MGSADMMEVGMDRVHVLLREYYTISRKIDELVAWLHPGMCTCEQCLVVNKEIRDLCKRQLEIIQEVNHAEQRADHYRAA